VHTIFRDEPNYSQIKILHVLTLNGKNGEYGGPVKVARELCLELESRGLSTLIFSGALRNSVPKSIENLAETYAIVSPLSKKLPISSLWSRSMCKKIFSLVRSSSVVHIHFARDLISFTAALACLLLRKPFIAQTHGMILSDSRWIVKIVDLIITRPLLNRAKMLLLLTSNEQLDILKMKLRCRTQVFRNGIATPEFSSIRSPNQIPKIIFCGRIHHTKGVYKFLEIARWAYKNGMNADFEIYGPDGGELNILKHDFDFQVKYRGAVPPQDVHIILKKSDLLIVPSNYDPYPMIVLESLSLGTPVLLSPHCGNSSLVKKYNKSFVADTNSVDDFCKKLIDFETENFYSRERAKIANFCKENFDIKVVVDELQKMYSDLL